MVTLTVFANTDVLTRPKQRGVIIPARIETLDQRGTKRLHRGRIGYHDASCHCRRIAVSRTERVRRRQTDCMFAFCVIATRRPVTKQWRRATSIPPASTCGPINDSRFRGVFVASAAPHRLRRLAPKHEYRNTNYRSVKPFHVMLLVCRRRRIARLQKRRDEPLGECSRNHRLVAVLVQAKYRAIPHAKASYAVRVQSVIT
jgi:hypothetical protein